LNKIPSKNKTVSFP